MKPWTRIELVDHVGSLGLGPGDAVMVHAGLRSIGPMEERGATFAGAVLDAIGADGTLLAYADWETGYEVFLRPDGSIPPEVASIVPPFDAATSSANPDNGTFPEIVRTWPGAMRSANAGASVVAVGRHAGWFVEDHPLDYGYGERSPLAKLMAVGGKVLMVGAPLDTMTLLHHAEHLARIPAKRIKRRAVPFLVDGESRWHMIEEFNTSHPVVAGLPEDYFREIVEAFLQNGPGQRGTVGLAPSVLVPADAIVAFAIAWLERRFARAGG